MRSANARRRAALHSERENAMYNAQRSVDLRDESAIGFADAKRDFRHEGGGRDGALPRRHSAPREPSGVARGPGALAIVLSLAACAPPQESRDAVVWPTERWPVSSPEAEGIRASALDSLVADIGAGMYGLVDALLVIRHGKVVADHRFEQDYDSVFNIYGGEPGIYNYDDPAWHPYKDGSDLHTLQSVTKSVSSAAFGIAVDEGFIPGVDAPAYAYFGDYEPYTSDARKGATTLEDFLTMRSGIHWVTEGGYDDAEHSTVLLEASDEWIRFVLDRPTDTEPGALYEYNDGVSVLLGKIVREATGRRMDDWARERLFEPVGIDAFYWKITPDGEADTEGGLYLTTHDLARIGYLFLREGEWDGEQIISRGWVRACTSPVVLDVEPDGTAYGYQWWVPVHENGEALVFAGYGYGGQFLFVVPPEDLVVVFNGWQHHERAERSTRAALRERILPAIVDPARDW